MNRTTPTFERGVTAVLTAILATVLLGSAGFAVDLGNAMQTQRRSQTAADSAAFAGVQYYRQHENDSVLTLLARTQNAGLEAKKYADLNTNVTASDWASCVDGSIPANYTPILTIGTGTCVSVKTVGSTRMRVRIPAKVRTGFGRVLGLSTIGASATADVGTAPTSTTTTPTTSSTTPTTSSTTTSTATSTTTTVPCLNPLLSNPSFENGLSGWQYSGNVQTWSQYVAEGSKSAYGQATSWLRQTVPAAPGFNYRMTFYGGTHDPAQHATTTMQFLNGSGTVIGQTTPFEMDFDVDVQPGGGVSAPYPTQHMNVGYGDIGGPYTVNMVAPGGTAQVRMLIEATGGDYFKIDNMQITKC